MKKALLFVLCATSFIVAQAQPTVTNSWTKSQTGILPVMGVNNNNPVAISAQGDMYVTGLFAGDSFSFAGKDLEPIATSSYLLKYAADGTEKWGVSLMGAATITAITTDETGNIYIAGNLADVVTFGSTNGATIDKEGLKKEDAFVSDQVAGFVAKYDANGVLKAVQSFVPKALPDLVATGMYSPESDALYFNINKLVYSNGKLYASALYTGLTENNGYSFRGSYQDPFGGVFFIDLISASVFSLNADMNVESIFATMAVSEPQTDKQMFVKSVSFAIAGGKLYSGFMAIGNETLTIGSQVQKFEFSMSSEGMIEYGHILSVIDLATNTSSLTKKYSTTHDIGNYCSINAMAVKGDVLLVAGTFNKQLSFDPSKEPTSTDDIYVAGLSTNSLDVNWTAISGYNEGALNQKEELFKGMAIVGNYVYTIGYTAHVSGHIAESPLAFWINISNGALSQANPANLTTGIAALDTKLATAQTRVVNEKLENIFAMNTVDNATSISTTHQDAGVSVYPNPVVNVLNFTTPCDVTIINLMGITVKQAKNVSDLNVSDLINGQYIVKVTTKDGISTVKVIKK